MKVPYIRTGYECLIAIKSNNKFVVSAEYDGTVLDVTKNKMTIEYDINGKKVKKEYPIKNWTTKEESDMCYTHIMVPNFKKGDKIKKDDSLIYDKLFFEPDVFDKTRVIYKQGTYVNVALMEDSQTWEDSASISSAMCNYLGTKTTKVRSIIVENTDAIRNMVKIGDTVAPNTILLSILDDVISSSDTIDEETLAILQELNNRLPKAKVKGRVNNIIVYYNCELNDMSKSLKELAIESDKKLLANQGFTGRVNSSYSIKGKPLMEGSIEIKIYIEVDEPMGIADKAILANQLKFTVGEVFYNKMECEDGTNVDVVFSTKSINARIVTSPILMGTTGMVLDKLKDNAVEMYFGKK